MKTQELDYDLPAELIAQQPPEIRGQSRMLVLDRQRRTLKDNMFRDIGDFLQSGDCLVLNDTKVLPARFYAKRGTGGKLEGLFLREDNGAWEVMLRGAGRIKNKENILLKDAKQRDYCFANIIEKKQAGKYLMRIEKQQPAEKILEDIGFAPVPPYIKRNCDPGQAAADLRRYQTVYAKRPGAIAAPTAGLHFTDELISELDRKGIKIAHITLHVGEGTFKPVSAEQLEEHRIHSERFSIDETNAGIINEAKSNRGRIIAVGTTSVRTLESVVANSKVKAADGKTDLFILPGHRFKIVDAIVTNFHLPRSTLLALVAAFAGVDTILRAYGHAIEKKYRFYSYGDAMLII